MISQDVWDSLITAAREAQTNAHAPYSKFSVGAAMLGKSGKIYKGTNVENASFGATSCAERSAIGTAVTEGEKEFAALVVITPADHPVGPCGICRQVLSEFCDDLPILLIDANDRHEQITLSELLPHRFVGDDI